MLEIPTSAAIVSPSVHIHSDRELPFDAMGSENVNGKTVFATAGVFGIEELLPRASAKLGLIAATRVERTVDRIGWHR